MADSQRGAVLPLALLILAVLAAGVTIAVMRFDERGGGVADPDGTVTPSPTFESPTFESPSPTFESPTVEPTVEPTTEPTVEPTTEPTVEPTEEPTEEPPNGGNGNGTTLAETGGPVLPYFLGGALMLAGSAGLWRLRRLFD